MTRREIRKRKDRNQRVLWLIQDTIGVVLFGGAMYGLALILWATM